MRIYQEEGDFDTSVRKALSEINEKYEEYPGLVVVGSHAPSQISDKLESIRDARQENVPFLGICLGMQLMLVEYARNELGLKGANTTEVDPETEHPVVVGLEELRVGSFEVAGQQESHWHQYAFNNEYKDQFDAAGVKMLFEGEYLEMARIMGHPYFVGVQYHPEYQSTKDSPHPLLKTFMGVCESLHAE